MRCPYCGSEDIIADPTMGNTVCGNPNCGELLETGAMVAEQNFMQTGSGGAAAVGHRINFSGIGAYGSGMQQSNTEMSVSRGITKIGWISDRLQLSAPVQEAARRMYQLAVQLNFNVGRATRYVACACLYIVCRRNKSPHLLIDFADVLQTPVRTLGKIYTGLLKRLVGGDPSHQAAICDMVEVPMIDPSVFIERFSRRLDLGSMQMQSKVQNTAMRIIQFMHRDWICIGRRPNGLCGAAILIASFFHGLKVPAKTIADVVRMREGTLKLRLMEMRQTPLAIMSRREFEQADLEKDTLKDDERRALPPCLLRSRRNEAQAALLDKEFHKDADGKQAALKDGSVHGRVKRLPPVPQMLPLPPVAASDKASSSTATATASSSTSAGAAKSADGTGAGVAAKFTTLEPSEEGIEDIAKDILKVLVPAKDGTDPIGLADLSRTTVPIEALLKDKPGFADDRHEGSDIGSSPSTPKSAAAAGKEESLSDVDDEDLELYLLDSEEQQNKSNIWHEVNKDYLEEWYVRGQEARRKRSKAGSSHAGGETTSETGSRATTGSTGKRSRRSLYPAATSCTQSAMMALSRKGKVGPNRINIEALESLFS
jgi:transcription factor IIIB subunit 2